MSAHLHREITPGCYRCDLSLDEMAAAELEEAEQIAREAACPSHRWVEHESPFDKWSVCSLCHAEIQR